VSFGGNAVTAAFCCSKLGVEPDLIATVANDWLGRMFQDMATKYGISIHPRKVKTSRSLHHAEGWQARHRALPRRRAHSSLPDPEPEDAASCMSTAISRMPRSTTQGSAARPAS
jgi:hypothetical protein